MTSRHRKLAEHQNRSARYKNHGPQYLRIFDESITILLLIIPRQELFKINRNQSRRAMLPTGSTKNEVSGLHTHSNQYQVLRSSCDGDLREQTSGRNVPRVEGGDQAECCETGLVSVGDGSISCPAARRTSTSCVNHRHRGYQDCSGQEKERDYGELSVMKSRSFHSDLLVRKKNTPVSATEERSEAINMMKVKMNHP